MERNPFSAMNQTLRSYRVYISPTMQGIICSYSNRTWGKSFLRLLRNT